MAPTLGWLRRLAAAVLLSVAASGLYAVDATWNYAVQVSARVSDSPPWTITLSWPEDTTATDYVPDYVLYRRRASEGSWGAPLALGAGRTTYQDTNVAEGERYEYQIVRQYRDSRYLTGNRDAYGYISAGIHVPLVDQRGRVILVVEDRVAAALSERLGTLRADLAGDGWVVTQVVVNAGDKPDSVRQQIRQHYYSSGGDAVFLLGRVPVAKAGTYAPDGHERRAMPADGFYGDMDGTWVDADGDGVFEGNIIPSDIELQVGRVDFSNMEAVGTGLDDLALTARYLDKNHAFRHGALRFEARALIGDRTGIDRGRAPAAGGYRVFSALYGAENIVEANTEDAVPDSERWISYLRSGSYGWAFGSGGGDFDRATFLGTQGEYYWVTSVDLATSARAGFYLMFGSYFVDWSRGGNLLRAALSAPDGGLGAAWAGRPSFLLHGLGLGDTIGEGVRLTQNNDTFYFSPTNAFRRGVHVAWMGDPTLRMDYIAPPPVLTGVRGDATISLTWQQSAAAGAVSYHVYRASSADGPYARLTGEPITGTAFTDTSPTAGGTYMVRAVALQRTASGSYQNASEGVVWTDTNTAPMPTPPPPPPAEPTPPVPEPTPPPTEPTPPPAEPTPPAPQPTPPTPEPPPQQPVPPPPPAPPTQPTPAPGQVKLALPLMFTPKPDSEQPGPKG